MKRLLFIFVSLMLLGAGCGGYVTGAGSNSTSLDGQRRDRPIVIIPGNPVGVSAIVAPALNNLDQSRAGNFSFTPALPAGRQAAASSTRKTPR